MAFQLSTAASLADVCAQIATFAVANAGFTDAGNITDGGQVVKRLVKGGIYYYFGQHTVSRGAASPNNIRFTMAFNAQAIFPLGGVFAAANIQPTPEVTSYMSAQAFPGPYPSLFLYTEGTCVHAVVELTNGVYNHFSFGKITKTDTFVGGEYMTAGDYTNLTSGFYGPLNTASNGAFFNATTSNGSTTYMLKQPPGLTLNDQRAFAPFGILTSYIAQGGNPVIRQGARGSVTQGVNERLLRDSPNQGTQRSVMFNNYIFHYDDVSLLYRCSGYIPNMRVLTIRSLDLAQVIYTDWQVFPISQRNGASLSIPNSIEMGVAYKR